jgi:hypothetical protein
MVRKIPKSLVSRVFYDTLREVYIKRDSSVVVGRGQRRPANLHKPATKPAADGAGSQAFRQRRAGGELR